MLFERVIAHSFGPFPKGASLELGPGLNIVHGPNEAGKSSWHAALYSGLCGLRRGPGRHVFNEQFSARHRPWNDPETWAVGAIIGLADGRRIELHHDLASRIGSTARDAVIAGRDYSEEIVFEGAPDGSVWLGLNRVSFLSTACIRQADMLGVLEDSGRLQEALQRAAATAGTDATAKRALDLLEKFHGENVGTERSPTKPLRVTQDRLAAAINHLVAAREAHDDYLERRARVDAMKHEVARLRAEENAIAALLARKRADEAEQRLERARRLQERFPDGAPRRSPEEDAIAQQVATALQSWQASPEPRPVSGETTTELESAITSVGAEISETLSTLSAPPRRHRPRSLALAAGSAAVAGSALLVADMTIPGLAVIAAALGLFAGWLLGGSKVDDRAAIEARIAALESRSDHLSHLLQDRIAAEESHRKAEERRDAAARAVLAAAAAAGVPGDEPGEVAEMLFSWQKARKKRLDLLDGMLEEWDTLQQLLAGQTIDEIEAHTERLRSEADALMAGVDSSLTSQLGDEVTEGDLTKIAASLERASADYHSAGGELRQFAGSLPAVHEAEEAVEAAQAARNRVIQLDATLKTTIEFLVKAEQEVHMGLAAVLKSTVEEWLGPVTGRRYTECMVDPVDLRVDVRGESGSWVEATLLSHGTAEQLYLLLRIALARHLTRQGEVCPLILDDVTASSDADRTNKILDTLHAISGKTQVVLFTHDTVVADWARANLAGDTDRFIELEGRPTKR